MTVKQIVIAVVASSNQDVLLDSNLFFQKFIMHPQYPVMISFPVVQFQYLQQFD